MSGGVPPAVRRPVSERSFQAAVIDLARRLGWLVGHHHDSRRQIAPGKYVGDRDAAGVPDLILVRGNRIVLAELKAEKGKLRPAQRTWIDALRAVESDAAGRVLVKVWTPNSWDEIERLLIGGES